MMELDDFQIEQSVRELMTRASYLPEGDEKIMTLEEALRIADTSHDISLQYRVRREYIDATFWGGDAEKTLVAYSWCLAQFDKYPEKFSQWELLWHYKWIDSAIVDFPQISREKIYALIDEMERRYLAAGYGLRVVNYYRYRTEKFFGNREKALEYFRRGQELGRDSLSDCAACEVDERVSFHIYCEDYDRAADAAGPILSGRYMCRTVPQRTLANLLIPYVQLGRWEEAYDLHVRGYGMVSRNVNLLGYVSEHLLFAALYRDFEKAAEILEKHLPLALKGKNLHNRYLFYRAAWMLFEALAASGRKIFIVRLPQSFPLYQESEKHRYQTSRLKEWFERETREIAEKYDARNGTDNFAQEIEKTLALLKLERP